MRILLDESLPRPLARLLPGHEVRTVAEMGWSGIESLRPLAPELLRVLPTLKRGDLIRVTV